MLDAESTAEQLAAHVPGGKCRLNVMKMGGKGRRGVTCNGEGAEEEGEQEVDMHEPAAETGCGRKESSRVEGQKKDGREKKCED